MFYEPLPRLLNWDVVRSLNYGQQKRKPAPAPLIQLKLDLAVLPKVTKYFAPIIPWFWTMEIGLTCVFWTNTVIKACVQLPLPLRKNCCAWATEIIEWACCHWTWLNCRLYPSHCPLRFITSHSRFALAMRKTKRLRRRLVLVTFKMDAKGTMAMSMSKRKLRWQAFRSFLGPILFCFLSLWKRGRSFYFYASTHWDQSCKYRQLLVFSAIFITYNRK